MVAHNSGPKGSYGPSVINPMQVNTMQNRYVHCAANATTNGNLFAAYVCPSAASTSALQDILVSLCFPSFYRQLYLTYVYIP